MQKIDTACENPLKAIRWQIVSNLIQDCHTRYFETMNCKIFADLVLAELLVFIQKNGAMR